MVRVGRVSSEDHNGVGWSIRGRSIEQHSQRQLPVLTPIPALALSCLCLLSPRMWNDMLHTTFFSLTMTFMEISSAMSFDARDSGRFSNPRMKAKACSFPIPSSPTLDFPFAGSFRLPQNFSSHRCEYNTVVATVDLLREDSFNGFRHRTLAGKTQKFDLCLFRHRLLD
ncbi:hypothetical protein L6452_15645 [Arctium lappa]|uniref:Uncharacterized protein n=1 Tax=Arctium lappa TaxID=4217 RepID=A0ACB9CP96_ARCLA|nr:hypothetical protein L6452_15645 [Arctium lappa]